MTTISIRRTHHLSKPQLNRIAEKIAAELEQEYGIQSDRTGPETFNVRGSGVTGTLLLAPKTIELNIKLGFLAAMFSASIRDGVEERLDQLLATKPKKK